MRRSATAALIVCALLAIAWCPPALAQTATIYQYDGGGNLTAVTSTSNDPNNCGAAGNVCPSGSACCLGACADLTSTASCGTCGNACQPVANGTVSCVQGACTVACASGYAGCGEWCAALDSDVRNCGACGNVCPSVDGGTASCVNGVCRAGCPLTDAVCTGRDGSSLVCVDPAIGPGACEVAVEPSATECTASPWTGMRVSDGGGTPAARRLPDCSTVAGITWPPSPRCEGGVCW